MGAGAIAEFKIVEAAAQRFAKGAVKKRLPMGSWSEVIDYCRTSMAFEGREIFRVLFLDRKNGLIADEIQGSGTVDHTPVYPREVMRRALELSATAIVLVHNHPSGDPTPSTQDIRMTLEIIADRQDVGPRGPRPHHHRPRRACVAAGHEADLTLVYAKERQHLAIIRNRCYCAACRLKLAPPELRPVPPPPFRWRKGEGMADPSAPSSLAMRGRATSRRLVEPGRQPRPPLAASLA